MAKFRPSSTIEEIRGSVGADTYSRVKSGFIIKAKSYPGSKHHYVITPRQAQINIKFGTIAPTWQNLTDAQRKAWNLLSATMGSTNIFGGHYTQSGFNFFTSLNYNLLLCGSPFILDPPEKPTIWQLKSFGIVYNTMMHPYLWIDFSGFSTGTYTAYFVYASPQVSVGITSCTNKYRFIDIIPPSTADHYNIFTSYTSLYGPINTGLKMFIKLKPVEIHTGFTGLNLYNYLII